MLQNGLQNTVFKLLEAGKVVYTFYTVREIYKRCIYIKYTNTTVVSQTEALVPGDVLY